MIWPLCRVLSNFVEVDTVDSPTWLGKQRPRGRVTAHIHYHILGGQEHRIEETLQSLLSKSSKDQVPDSTR